MLNLIDQSDILKGLDDQRLQQEMQQPSGAVPPFLVLSEISRRKDMRQRYAGELATQAPKTTVMQDVLAAPAMPGAGPIPMGGQNAPMGLAAAAQMGGGGGMPSPGGPGFASGGLVDASTDLNDYAALTKRYQSDLSNIDSQRNQDAALALIAAGAGIAGGGHSNFGQNFAVGVDTGLNAYQKGLQTTDARETTALRGLQDIAASTNAEAMQKLQYQLELRRQQQAEDPNSVTNTPDDIRKAQAIAAMPDGPEKDLAIKLSMPYASLRSQDLNDNAAAIGDAIIGGQQPPTTTGLGYGMAGPVKAYLAKQGYDLTGNFMKYQADLKNVSALNSPQQLRVRQGVDQLDQTLDNVQQLADEWNGSGFPPFNKAALAAEANNPSDPKKQALATELLAQVDHITSELGQVYMGGNTPTDAAFHLAASQLSADWSKATFDAMIKQTKQNLAIRRASLLQAGVVPASVAPAPAPGSAPDPNAPAGGGAPDYKTKYGLD